LRALVGLGAYGSSLGSCRLDKIYQISHDEVGLRLGPYKTNEKVRLKTKPDPALVTILG
jgi:hypothetical protein